MTELFREMKNFVKQALFEAGSHGFDHTLRVVSLCEIIGEAEQAEMEILIPAAIFHDIARPLERKTGISHEIKGAEMTEEFLTGISYGEERILRIVHAIKAHRFSTALVPETLEAKILSDADKLDAMGAVGIARTFISAGEHGGDITDGLEHMYEKLLRLSDMMYTRTGKEMAERRHTFLVAFVQALEEERGMEERGG
ncbi:HD domain-containing protein [Methanospirillum hungatei]|uniref:HD domain-containing protein n=1 Tax=Methanospirillum hungatei TaxID=2203 RepID=UPI0026EF87E9|nr:HD domain-containing protein [Methanospirillum hungatei]MCA1915698.1 HD domain-containing protein [Methanospirillum hungatei]